jgi:geranylgeranyl reductase family protein
MRFDLIIVGAGPGGTACALTLKNSGLKVALVDKAEFPRDKICGDALSGKVPGILAHINPEVKASFYQFSSKLGSWGIRFVAPNRKKLDIPFKTAPKHTLTQAPGFVSTRMDFDNFLFQCAAELPEITIFEGFEILDIHRENGQFILSSADQSLETPLIIGADGAHSVVNRKLGQIKVDKKHYSAGLRAYYEGVTGFQEDNYIELHFIKDLLPGYFWIFPLPGGKANVGLGMLSQDISRSRVDLKKEFTRIITEDPNIAPRFAQATQIDKLRGFGLPLGSKKRKISGEGFMLVGDAASLIDPFSGEGIGNAMLSGKKAAEQAIKCFENRDYSAGFMSNYDETVYQKIWSELSLSHRMQKLLNYPWLFDFVVNRASRSPSLQKMFTMMFDNIDIRRELSRPRFYWDVLRGK